MKNLVIFSFLKRSFVQITEGLEESGNDRMISLDLGASMKDFATGKTFEKALLDKMAKPAYIGYVLYHTYSALADVTSDENKSKLYAYRADNIKTKLLAISEGNLSYFIDEFKLFDGEIVEIDIIDKADCRDLIKGEDCPHIKTSYKELRLDVLDLMFEGEDLFKLVKQLNEVNGISNEVATLGSNLPKYIAIALHEIKTTNDLTLLEGNRG